MLELHSPRGQKPDSKWKILGPFEMSQAYTESIAGDRHTMYTDLIPRGQNRGSRSFILALFGGRIQYISMRYESLFGIYWLAV